MERLGVPRADALLALGLFLVGQLEIWVIGSQGGAKEVLVPMIASLTLPLAWRRRAPLAVLSVPFAVLVAIAIAVAVLEVEMPQPLSVASLAGWIVAVYSTGAHADLPRSLTGAAMGLSFQPIAVVADPDRSFAEMEPVQVLFVLIPWLAGSALRRERVQAGRLRELAERLDSEREQHARAAVGEERTRIARELHDELAHSMSIIAIQADAAEGALARRPELAREPLRAIRATARTALADMRRVVGVLRDVDEQAELAPRAGLGQLATLVDEARAAGLDVELLVAGEPRRLPPGLDVSAYRILQEGLTNVRKHAGTARADVIVRYGAGGVELEVRNHGGQTASAGDGGHGLLGVRERVALYGGEMDAGPGADGGFILRARLPLDAAAR